MEVMAHLVGSQVLLGSLSTGLLGASASLRLGLGGGLLDLGSLLLALLLATLELALGDELARHLVEMKLASRSDDLVGGGGGGGLIGLVVRHGGIAVKIG